MSAERDGSTGPGRTDSVAAPSWPEERDEGTAPRHDWRDTLRNATDLALLGVLVTVAALPVLTAGAAVATASSAVRHWLAYDRWPDARRLLRDFGRGVLPGAGATLAAGAAAALLGLNLLALGRGLVPGGRPLLVVTAALAVAAVGLAGLTVVEVGRRGGRGWLLAVRAAARLAGRRPVALLASAGVLVLAAVLGAMVLPLLTPILAGYTLFALHAVARRAGW
ncbi:hypothetical protein AB0J86_11270 [Micromonospora sp. NPDC049559]|uniref:hypothetical protein n=1 Tax=Micromonospora sp. NPDC049559 TaxID=3155923 RepID=UPI00343F34E2